MTFRPPIYLLDEGGNRIVKSNHHASSSTPKANEFTSKGLFQRFLLRRGPDTLTTQHHHSVEHRRLRADEASVCTLSSDRQAKSNSQRHSATFAMTHHHDTATASAPQTTTTTTTTTTPSSKTYQITEPHPTTAPYQALGSGRGGAGNFVRAPPDTSSGADATGPASRFEGVKGVPMPTSQSAAVKSGRGGAGNMTTQYVVDVEGTDEGVEKQAEQEEARRRRRRRTSSAEREHERVGRGGAGNVV